MTTPLFIFSIVGGVLTFLALSLEERPAVALLFGAIAALLISLAIPGLFALSDRKFLPLKREIKEKIIIDERVNYVVGEEIKEGFIVTTKESLYIISSDNKKPVKFEIKRTDVKKISISEGVFLNIFLDYNKCIRVFAGNCEELSSRLADEGFGK